MLRVTLKNPTLNTQKVLGVSEQVIVDNRYLRFGGKTVAAYERDRWCWVAFDDRSEWTQIAFEPIKE